MNAGTPPGNGEGEQHASFREDVTLEGLRQKLSAFAKERDWEKYHTPRNLLLALVGEVGETAELFQWRPDAEVVRGLPGFTPAEREHVGEELSDVLLYLVRLADVCGIDLAQAACDKIRKNAAKYPSERCHGSSAKYTAYGGGQEQQGQGRQQGQEEGQQEDGG